MGNTPEWVKQLEAEPCKCIRCPNCNGSGDYDAWGHYVDDMDDPEPCDMCRGGITEECDRCTALNDYEMDLL
jgi:hypothetical protein